MFDKENIGTAAQSENHSEIAANAWANAKNQLDQSKSAKEKANAAFDEARRELDRCIANEARAEECEQRTRTKLAEHLFGVPACLA